MPNPLDDARVYTLDDLKSWENLRPGLPPSLAVLGHPVAHSVSPQMHNAALAELAQSHPVLRDWRYFKFAIAPEQLPAALELLQQKNIRGVNLTVPHKTAPEVVAHADHEIRAYGAVNTLIGNGRYWHGDNSDGYGLIQSLKRDLEVNLRYGAEIVVLGVGGAARAAVVACLREGCGKVWVGNRTLAKLQPFVEQWNRSRPLLNPHPLEGFALANPPAAQWSANVAVINATTVGLKPDDSAPLDVSLLGREAVVLDMIYRRNGPTPLVAAARARGLRAVDGLGMLVWQGAYSLRVWLSALAKVQITTEEIAPTMMTAACAALGLPLRHV